MYGSRNLEWLFEQMLAELCKHEKLEIKIMADVLVDIGITVSPATAPLAVDANGVPGTATVGQPYSGTLKESGELSGAQSPVGDIRLPIAAITWAFSAQHGSRAAEPASASERTLDACEH